MNVRKMAFWEIGLGKLAKDVQHAFEEIQKAVQEIRAKGSVTLKINVFPATGEDRYGKVNYEVQKTLPKETSTDYTTQLNGQGLITKTADSEIKIDQIDLEFSEGPMVVNFNKEGK